MKPEDNEPKETVAPQAKTRSPFVKEIDHFIGRINSLRNLYTLLSQTMSKSFEDASANFNRYVNDECDVTKTTGDDGQIRINIIIKNYWKYKKEVKRFQDVKHSLDIVPRSLLNALVSEFDVYYGKLIRLFYLTRPEALSGAKNKLPYSKLVTFGSMKEAKEYILEKRIEAVMRKSHAFQFAWLERQLNMTLRKDLDIWPTFIEITERRNLFVHTNGLVSNQYLTVCDKHGVFSKKSRQDLVRDWLVKLTTTILHV